MVSKSTLGIKTLNVELLQKDYEWIAMLKNEGESWEAFLIRVAKFYITSGEAMNISP